MKETTEGTVLRTLKSGRKVRQPAPPPPAVEVQFEKCVRPYRKAEEGRVIFGDPNPDVYYRPIRPEPEPPSPPDQLKVDEIPLGKVKELLQEFTQSKKNTEGVRFSGGHVKLMMKDESILEGWLPDREFQKFKRDGIISGFRRKKM